jgi:large subunit ribosomal protein L24
MKIKKNDTVIIISGRDKDKKGKVVQTLIEKNRVTVENINLRKKSVKPRKSGEKGQIVEFPAPMNVSNVMLVCPKCSVSTRVGYQRIAGKKKRFCKKCQKEI